MCIYIYICIYKMCAYIYIYICIHTYTYMYTYQCTLCQRMKVRSSSTELLPHSDVSPVGNKITDIGISIIVVIVSSIMITCV